MPDAPPAVVLLQSDESDYSLPSEWVERARNFRVLASADGLVLVRSDCPAGEMGEIVVCAMRDDAHHRLNLEAPPPTTLMQEVGEKLNFQIGPLEAGSVDVGNGTRAAGVRIRF